MVYALYVVLKMKSNVFAIACLLGPISVLDADGSDEAVVGVADLAKLTESRVFKLNKTYKGSLKMCLGIVDVSHPKEHERIINSFAYATEGLFAEPDRPTPLLDAVFHNISPTEYGHFAFFDKEMQYVHHKLKDVKTMMEFKELVPRAIPIFFEQFDKDDPEVYWYSWAEIDDRKRLIVSYIEVEQDGDNFDLWLWEGECHPQNIKAEQGGAVKPATAPESKSEGEEKPQPEAEGRSR